MAFNDSKKGEQSKSSSLWWLFYVILGLLLVAIVLAFLLLRGCTAEEATPPKESITGGVVPGDIDTSPGGTSNPGGKDAQTLVNEAVAQGMFRVFISTHIVIDEEGNFSPLIQNSQVNGRSCWVEFKDDYGVTIYETDVIPPGYKIEYDTLEKVISRGKHDCQAYFHILSGLTKDSDEVNSVAVGITLVQS